MCVKEGKLLRYKPAGAPSFDPELYDSVPTMFNCYAYALRIPEQGWAHAGQVKQEVATGELHEKKKLNPRQLNALIESDGLIRILEHGLVNDEHHIIAAYVKPEKGYHFFSLDLGNTWSHKAGELPVERIEKPVSLPSVGQKTGEFEFTGFFTIPKNGILYYPRLLNHLS